MMATSSYSIIIIFVVAVFYGFKSMLDFKKNYILSNNNNNNKQQQQRREVERSILSCYIYYICMYGSAHINK